MLGLQTGPNLSDFFKYMKRDQSAVQNRKWSFRFRHWLPLLTMTLVDDFLPYRGLTHDLFWYPYYFILSYQNTLLHSSTEWIKKMFYGSHEMEYKVTLVPSSQWCPIIHPCYVTNDSSSQLTYCFWLRAPSKSQPLRSMKAIFWEVI